MQFKKKTFRAEQIETKQVKRKKKTFFLYNKAVLTQSRS